MRSAGVCTFTNLVLESAVPVGVGKALDGYRLAVPFGSLHVTVSTPLVELGRGRREDKRAIAMR